RHRLLGHERRQPRGDAGDDAALRRGGHAALPRGRRGRRDGGGRPLMAIKSIDHWVIVAGDLQRTLDFYARLGFTIAWEKRPGRPDMATIRINAAQKINVRAPDAPAQPGYLGARRPTVGGADFCLEWDGTVDEVLAVLKRNPIGEKYPVELVFVCADLVDRDDFLVQESLDRLSARRDAGDVDALPLITKVAVCLGDIREPILLEYTPDPRRISLVHLIDAEHELDGDALLVGELGEERMLGGAGSTPFLEHQPELASIGDAPVGEPQDMMGCLGKVATAGRSKHPGHGPVEDQRLLRESFKRLGHGI